MKIKNLARFRDGGTLSIAFEDDDTVYVDSRMGITEAEEGKVYTKYPNKEGAVVITARNILLEIVRALEVHANDGFVGANRAKASIMKHIPNCVYSRGVTGYYVSCLDVFKPTAGLGELGDYCRFCGQEVI